MLCVRHCLWKALLQWNKPSLSLVSMAWACWVAAVEQKNCATRTFRRKACSAALHSVYLGCIRGIDIQPGCVQEKLYTHSAFIWEVWRLPHENWPDCNSFSSLLFQLLLILKPHTPIWLTAAWTPVSLSSRSTCFTGLWATWRIRVNALVTQAGQSYRTVGVSELQSTAEALLLLQNHLITPWWLHLAGISPPHTSREAASDMVINCRVNTSIFKP